MKTLSSAQDRLCAAKRDARAAAFLLAIIFILKIAEAFMGLPEEPGVSLHLWFQVANAVFAIAFFCSVCAAAGNLMQYVVTGVVVVPHQ